MDRGPSPLKLILSEKCLFAILTMIKWVMAPRPQDLVLRLRASVEVAIATKA